MPRLHEKAEDTGIDVRRSLRETKEVLPISGVERALLFNGGRSVNLSAARVGWQGLLYLFFDAKGCPYLPDMHGKDWDEKREHTRS